MFNRIRKGATEARRLEGDKTGDGALYLVVDGNAAERDLKDVSQVLSNATEEEQREFEISPSGYGIHWPLIDEDISIDGLLGIMHKPDTNRRSA
ncbi:MAG: DUF2442 domain-containing protein [Methylococcales bacterium]